jgi:hypothetical protein
VRFVDKLEKEVVSTRREPSFAVGNMRLVNMRETILIAAEPSDRSMRSSDITYLENIMKTLASIVVALAMSAGIASAQTPVAPTAEPSVATKVEHWTKKQWNAAKADWEKDKTKWADCQQRSTDQKLTGRKSWSFLYTCMKS